MGRPLIPGVLSADDVQDEQDLQDGIERKQRQDEAARRAVEARAQHGAQIENLLHDLRKALREWRERAALLDRQAEDAANIGLRERDISVAATYRVCARRVGHILEDSRAKRS